ncbi:hypothetical protein BaRGS_00026925, partial [Batillaria attramentaria]
CIPIDARCDRKTHCVDGSDEENCKDLWTPHVSKNLVYPTIINFDGRSSSEQTVVESVLTLSLVRVPMTVLDTVLFALFPNLQELNFSHSGLQQLPSSGLDRTPDQPCTPTNTGGAFSGAVTSAVTVSLSSTGQPSTVLSRIVARGCVKPADMKMRGFLALSLAVGVIGMADAVCDDACDAKCQTRFQDCFMTYMSATSRERQAQRSYFTGTSGPLASAENFKMAVQAACADPENNVIDACSNLKSVLDCLDANMQPNCADSSVGPTLAKIRDDTSQPPCVSEPIPAFHTASKGYAEFGPCMDTLPRECTGNRDLNQYWKYMRAAYTGYYNLYCNAKACPSAVSCAKSLADKPEPTFAGQTGTDGGDGFLYISGGPALIPPLALPNVSVINICPAQGFSGRADVFDCLNSAAASCGKDQSTVSFSGLKNAYLDLCVDFLPKVVSPAVTQGISQCQPYARCLSSSGLLPDMARLLTLKPDDVPGPVVTSRTLSFLGNTTTSGFWCSWLHQHYQCAIRSAQACRLPKSAVDLARKKEKALMENCE